MVLVLSRGAFCPKDRRQAEGLLELHREMEVGYCRLVTISTDNITETNEYRSGVGAHCPFLSDTRRIVQKDLDIAEYTDPVHNPMIPHVIVLEPGLVIYKIYNGYWFFGRHFGKSPAGPARCHQEMPAGLGHHDARTQGGVAARPQGTLLPVRQNVRPNSRCTGLGGGPRWFAPTNQDKPCSDRSCPKISSGTRFRRFHLQSERRSA